MSVLVSYQDEFYVIGNIRSLPTRQVQTDFFYHNRLSEGEHLKGWRHLPCDPTLSHTWFQSCPCRIELWTLMWSVCMVCMYVCVCGPRWECHRYISVIITPATGENNTLQHQLHEKIIHTHFCCSTCIMMSNLTPLLRFCSGITQLILFLSSRRGMTRWRNEELCTRLEKMLLTYVYFIGVFRSTKIIIQLWCHQIMSTVGRRVEKCIVMFKKKWKIIEKMLYFINRVCSISCNECDSWGSVWSLLTF